MWQRGYIPFLLTLYISHFTVSAGLNVHAHPSSEWSYQAGRAKQLGKLNNYDITIPYRLDGRQRRDAETLTEGGHLEEATFVLQLGREEITVDLKLNEDLFPARFIQRSYLPDGRLLTRKPHRLHHCYYHGEVRGKNSSRVALSTCNGLSGLIIIDGKSHYVERLSDSEGEHVVYTPDSVRRKKKTWVYDTGLSNEPVASNWPESMHQQARVRRDVFDETKYVELFIVADNAEFIDQGSDKEKVFARCKEMANAMDMIYRQLNMRVALIGVEVWDEGDQFDVSTNPTLTMQYFHRWRKETLLPNVYNDNAQFVTGKSFDGSTVGMASLSVMCSLDRSGGVNEDHGVNAADVASTMAHEMGHNMGFVHDTEDRNCQCDAPASTGCVMEPSSGSIPPTIFSSCSQADLEAALLKGLGACLFNYPKEIFQGPHCGNGFLEKGEECDCGTVEECKNECCVPERCILHENATCANGECCEDCQLKEAGVRCRDEVNECDLPEYCTGIDNECPGNVYRQNGEDCKTSDAICYNGQCVTYDDQCRALWGNGATNGHELCYDFNEQGSNHGNCGMDENDNFIRCPKRDLKCGKLMCEGGADFPIIGSLARASVGYRFDSQGVRHTCKSAGIDLGDDIPDPGYVGDGSLCGSSKTQLCFETSCVNKSDLNIRDCPFNCYNHGVCNSNNHCHCDPKWAPPLCKSSGYGGSIDSGPARPQGDEVEAYNNTMVALLVVFLVVVPGLVSGGIAAFIKRQKLQQILCKKSSVPPVASHLQRPMYKHDIKRPSRQGFKSVPESTSTRADVTNGHPARNPTPRPDIVVNTYSASRDPSVVYKPTTEPVRPPPLPPQRPDNAPPSYVSVVRQESSKRKPANPPPPVPSTPAEVKHPNPVRKAPTKPPAPPVTSPPAPPPAPPMKPPSAPPRPPPGLVRKPVLPKPPSLPSASTQNTTEPANPGSVALRPPTSRPPVPRVKFNANNSAATPEKEDKPKPVSRPTPPPRPESLRIKSVAVPKQRPPIPRRPSSTSGNPSV
ncbi:disintegrin and metalloproteinase domain-containing protein 12-like isoform X3 [Acanthaster planci]|uniref:Disintegrin and metalloproteinase domain-containing protein 12-like isoform X3 n=1 Tax=Acanthaster planci TaxID=133434 RepID=A0A8B7YY85_ACAPL|nr:disintegrin and metalloproteinase domain-containing protein 12-like isoform X3 [Acanthaster planci]